MNDHTSTYQLILASASPRRQQFLRDLGLTFTIQVADIDETPRPNEEPIGLARRLAERLATKPRSLIAARTLARVSSRT